MSQEVFREFVHYVCSTCEDLSLLSETKLHKALWFVDTYAYQKFGHALSEGTHIKKPNGPVVPQLSAALAALENAGVLRVRSPSEIRAGLPPYDLIHPSAGERWSKEERQLTHTVVNNICMKYTDASISELSHDEIWRAVEVDEKMPVAAVLAARAGKITEEDKRWAEEVLATLPQHEREMLGEGYEPGT